MYGYYNSWVLHCVGSLVNEKPADKTRRRLLLKARWFCSAFIDEAK